MTAPKDSSRDDPLRKELARQIRLLLRDEGLTIPGRINLIGDLILSPVLLILAVKPLVIDLLSGLTVRLKWLTYTGKADWVQFLESLFWVLLFIVIWTACIMAFTDYRKMR